MQLDPQSAFDAVISFKSPTNTWAKELQTHLAAPLLLPLNEAPCNIVFACQEDEMVHWNGLAFLASLSPLFRPRSEEEQRFTVLLPEYNASLVKKLLLLLSLGTSTVKPEEVNMLAGLAKDLGVSSASIRDFMTH